MITLGPALFDNNRLITLSGGYKNLHYLTQFIVTFYMYKNIYFLKKLCSVACCLFAFSTVQHKIGLQRPWSSA
jgi:hypothetical protein